MNDQKTLDLKALDTSNRPQLIQEILNLEGELPGNLREGLLEIIRAPKSSNLAKSSAAFLLGKKGVMEGVSLLLERIGEAWIPFGGSNDHQQADPAAALTLFGPSARPELEAFLAESDDSAEITQGTIIIFNIMRSKEEARKSVLKARENRSSSDAHLFDNALQGLDIWKG